MYFVISIGFMLIRSCPWLAVLTEDGSGKDTSFPVFCRLEYRFPIWARTRHQKQRAPPNSSAVLQISAKF